MDNAIAGMSPEAVLAPADLSDMTKAAQVLGDQVGLEEGWDSSNADLGHCICRGPTINQSMVVGGPWDSHREAV